MASIDTYLDRIIAIAGDIPGITSASNEYPTDAVAFAAAIPFLYVLEGEAEYTRINSNQVRITRDFLSLLYVRAYTPENATQENAAWDAARPFLTSYPAYFLARSRLQRNDQGVADIISATVAGDSGIQTASRYQINYACVYYRHTIVYEEFINEV